MHHSDFPTIDIPDDLIAHGFGTDDVYRDDAPDDGPCIILEDVLAELAPPDDTSRAFGPGRAAPAWWRV